MDAPEQPPTFQHPGSVPPRPEVPDNLPLAWSVPPPGARRPDGMEDLPPWPAWTPFVGMLMAFAAALIGVVVLSVIVELAGGEADGEDPVINIGGTLVQDFGLIAAAVILARMVAPDRAAPRDFGLRIPRFWRSVGWIMVTWVAFFAFALVWSLIVGPEEQDDLTKSLGADDSTVALVVVAVLVTVVAPITEELFFRGFFFTAMRRWIGLIPGALLTGVIFGGIHAGGTPVVLLVVLAVFGFLLCLLYVWTKSLIPCIVLHALNNSIALGVSQDWIAEIPLLMAGSTIVVLALTLPFSRR